MAVVKHTVADAVKAFDVLAEKVRGMTADAAQLRADASQKPYIGKTGNTWELLNSAGKVIKTASSMEALQSDLKRELAKYDTRSDSASPPSMVVKDGRLYTYRGNNRLGKDGTEYEYEHPANNGKLMKIWLTRGEANARADAGPAEEPNEWIVHFEIGRGSNKRRAEIKVKGKLSDAVDKAKREAYKEWPDAIVNHVKTVAAK